MNVLNAYRPVKPVECALNIREIATDSWWVYRREVCANGRLKPLSRVVFFGRSRADAEHWIEAQHQETTVYMLSDN